MLIFNESQYQAFQEDRFDQLCYWLVSHLREHFALYVSEMDDDNLRELIDRTVTRAREIGATESETICHFVHIRVLFGGGFEALPWVADTLATNALSGDEMMRRLASLSEQALDIEEASE